MSYGVPAAEVCIDTELVSSLLEVQHPDLARDSLRVAGEGWDCVMVRIGDDLAARMPRRASAVPLVEVERRWLGRLGPRLPVPTPIPERTGKPSDRYPWPWTIVPWFEGEAADRRPLGEAAAQPLAEFLVALHQPAPLDAPENPWRGVALSLRADTCEEWLDDLLRRPDGIGGELGRDVQAVWRRALDAPIDVPSTWLHGDLHPRNVICREGSLAAVVDWGDVCRGDRATDLASLWMLLPTAKAWAQARAILDAAAHVSEATWARARGWAVFFGAIMLVSGLDDADHRFANAGRRTLERVASY